MKWASGAKRLAGCVGPFGGASVSASELPKMLKRLQSVDLRHEWVDKPKYLP